MTPDGSTLYVANNGANSVSVISTATNTVIATITDAGTTPNLMAMHPDGTELYVSGFDNFVAVVSTATNTVVDSIPGIEFVLGLGINSDGAKLYALTPFSGSVVEVSTATHSVASTFPMPFPNAIGNFINGVNLTAGLPPEVAQELGVTAFPNPFAQSTTLGFDQRLTNATVRIVDQSGRVVRMMQQVSGQQLEFDRGTLANGLYTAIIVQDGSKVSTIKLTIGQ